MDQSNRYADLSLKEDDLIAGGKHILVAYKMKPKPGFGSYLACAAHFAAESSTGTNVEVSTTDDFTRGLDEGISTRLLVYAATLIRGQVAPVEACRMVLVRPITDDADIRATLDHAIDAVFG